MPRGVITENVAVLAAETDLYEVPAAIVQTLIQKAEFTNTGTTVVILNVWLTASGISVTSDDAKRIVDMQIGVGETYLAPELIGEYVNSLGKIIAEGDVTGVSARINGNQMKTAV